jgi:DNA-binding response OmpR family regulator
MAKIIVFDDGGDICCLLTEFFKQRGLPVRVERGVQNGTERTAANEELLKAGDLTLSPEARRAWFAGSRLPLTAMEYAVLEMLMRDCGRVVSRDDFSRELHGREASVFERSVDTHVTRIRRKLGQGRHLIQSVRGLGYQLCPPELHSDNLQSESGSQQAYAS